MLRPSLEDDECPDLSVYVLLHPQGQKVLKELKYDPARDWGLPVSSLRSVGYMVGGEDEERGSGQWELVPHGCYEPGEELNRAVMDAVRRNGWGHVVDKGPRWNQFRRFGVLERSSNKEVALEYVRRVQEEGEWALLADLATMLYERFALARDAMLILRSDPDLRRLRDLFLDEEGGHGADPAVARILRGGGGGGGDGSVSSFVSGGSSVQYMSMRFPPPVLNVLHSYPHLVASSSSPEMCADLLEFMARLKTGVANVLREWERGCVFQGFKPGGGDWGVYFAHKQEEGGSGGEEKEEDDKEEEEEEGGEEPGGDGGGGGSSKKRKNPKDKKKKKKKTKGGGSKAKAGHEHLRAQCMVHVERVNSMVCDMLKLVPKSGFVIPELARILVRVAEDRAVVSMPDHASAVAASASSSVPSSSSSSLLSSVVHPPLDHHHHHHHHTKRMEPPLVAVYRCSFRWTFMCLLTERAQTLTGGVVPTFKDVYDLFVKAEAEAGRRSVVAAAAQDSSFAAGKRDGTMVKKRTRGGWRGFGGYADPMEVLLFDGPCRRGAPREFYQGWKQTPDNVVRAPRCGRGGGGRKKPLDKS